MRKLFLLLSSLILTACGAEHGGNTGSDSQPSLAAVTAESVQAFESTIYNFGKTTGCVKCHGGSVNPQWLNADPRTGYSFARPLIDFANPTVSTFAAYVANNHCNDPVCRNSANIPVMQDLLLQWAAIEATLNGGGLPPSNGETLPTPAFATATMAIPANPPVITSGQRALVRFDLSQLSPPVPRLSGAILEISIQYYNAIGTTYRIFEPRVVGASAPVTMDGFHVYVRASTGSGIGSEFVNQGNIWSSLVANIGVVAVPSPLPAGAMTSVMPLVGSSLAIPVQSASDVITIGFKDIR